MPQQPESSSAVTAQEDALDLSIELKRKYYRPLYYAHHGLIGASRLATQGLPCAESLAAKHEALKRKASTYFLLLVAGEKAPPRSEPALSPQEERQTERFIRANRTLIENEAEELELSAEQTAETIVNWLKDEKEYTLNGTYIDQKNHRIRLLKQSYIKMINRRNPLDFPQPPSPDHDRAPQATEKDGRPLAEHIEDVKRKIFGETEEEQTTSAPNAPQEERKTEHSETSESSSFRKRHGDDLTQESTGKRSCPDRSPGR